jgi:hypothetical protein
MDILGRSVAQRRPFASRKKQYRRQLQKLDKSANSMYKIWHMMENLKHIERALLMAPLLAFATPSFAQTQPPENVSIHLARPPHIATPDEGQYTQLSGGSFPSMSNSVPVVRYKSADVELTRGDTDKKVYRLLSDKVTHAEIQDIVAKNQGFRLVGLDDSENIASICKDAAIKDSRLDACKNNTEFENIWTNVSYQETTLVIDIGCRSKPNNDHSDLCFTPRITDIGSAYVVLVRVL